MMERLMGSLIKDDVLREALKRGWPGSKRILLLGSGVMIVFCGGICLLMWIAGV